MEQIIHLFVRQVAGPPQHVTPTQYQSDLMISRRVIFFNSTTYAAIPKECDNLELPIQIYSYWHWLLYWYIHAKEVSVVEC